jgi:hypothetical protein
MWFSLPLSFVKLKTYFLQKCYLILGQISAFLHMPSLKYIWPFQNPLSFGTPNTLIDIIKAKLEFVNLRLQPLFY